MPMVKFLKAYMGAVAGTSWAVDEGVHFDLSKEEADKIELDQPGTILFTDASETLDSPRPVTREKPTADLPIGDYRVPTKTVKLDPIPLTDAEKTALAKATGEDVPDDAVATVRGLKVPKSDRMVKGAANRAATDPAEESAPSAVSLQPEEVAKHAGLVSSVGDDKDGVTKPPAVDAKANANPETTPADVTKTDGSTVTGTTKTDNTKKD